MKSALSSLKNTNLQSKFCLFSLQSTTQITICKIPIWGPHVLTIWVYVLTMFPLNFVSTCEMHFYQISNNKLERLEYPWTLAPDPQNGPNFNIYIVT